MKTDYRPIVVIVFCAVGWFYGWITPLQAGDVGRSVQNFFLFPLGIVDGWAKIIEETIGGLFQAMLAFSF